jgi:hypothetical protein
MWQNRESFLPLLEEIQEKITKYWSLISEILIVSVPVDHYSDVRESLILECQIFGLDILYHKLEEYCSGVQSVASGKFLTV